jgi:hypothetical protein
MTELADESLPWAYYDSAVLDAVEALLVGL